MLDLRISFEKEEKNQLGILNVMLQEAINEKERIGGLLQKTIHECNEAQSLSSLDINLLIQYQRYIESLKKMLFQAEEVVEVRNEQVENQKLVLIEATKKVKILEKLKDKEQITFRKETDKKEGILLDEIGIQKYIRKQGENL